MLTDDEIRDYVSSHPRCTYDSLVRDLNLTRTTLYKTLSRLNIRLPKKYGLVSKGNEEWRSSTRCIPTFGYCPTLDRMRRAEMIHVALQSSFGATMDELSSMYSDGHIAMDKDQTIAERLSRFAYKEVRSAKRMAAV